LKHQHEVLNISWFRKPYPNFILLDYKHKELSLNSYKSKYCISIPPNNRILCAVLSFEVTSTITWGYGCPHNMLCNMVCDVQYENNHHLYQSTST
jgi:hypothetical protein